MVKKELKYWLITGVLLLILCSPLIYLYIRLEIKEAKYNAVKEVSSGEEITVIADEYCNANINSVIFDENVLECVKRDEISTGMFAGTETKQYYVFKGKNQGETDIEFYIYKFADLYRKVYSVAVDDSLVVTVLNVDETIVEK